MFNSVDQQEEMKYAVTVRRPINQVVDDRGSPWTPEKEALREELYHRGVLHTLNLLFFYGGGEAKEIAQRMISDPYVNTTALRNVVSLYGSTWEPEIFKILDEIPG